jgi:diguanylate cyclase (GGDEF)-like protein
MLVGVMAWQVIFGRDDTRIGTIAVLAAALGGGSVLWVEAGSRAPASIERRLFALGCWMWALWRIVEADAGRATEHESVSAVAANATFFATIALLVSGIGRLRPQEGPSPNGIKRLLDFVIGAATLVAVGWTWVARPALDDGGLGRVARTTVALHLCGEGLVLASLLVVLSHVGDRHMSAALGLVAAGACLLMVGDVLWLTSMSGSGNDLSRLAVPAWLAGFVVLATFGARRRRGARAVLPSQLEVAPSGEPFWRVALLYGQALLLLVTIGVEATTSAGMRHGLPVIVGSLAIIAAIMVRLGLTLGESQRAAGRLTQQIDLDPLTGLVNHRRVHQRLDRELADARAYGGSVAIALLDIDNFKAVNDRCGHQAGDRVLRTIADVLTRTCRSTDIAGRYAGDEFMLILPGLELADARKVGQRLLDEIARCGFRPAADPPAAIGVSIGLAVSRNGEQSAKQVIAIADAAMYDAKARGKNRVVIVDADRLVTEAVSTSGQQRGFLAQPERVRLARPVVGRQ